MKENGYFDYLEQLPNGNEPDNQTIDNAENQEKLSDEDIIIPKSNGSKRKPKAKNKDEHLSTALTRGTTKSRKIPYGKIISYTMPKNEIPNPINQFFQEHRDIYNLTYSYFSDRISHFISQNVIELKYVIVNYALQKINFLINGGEINPWQLVGIDYVTFCVNLSKQFIDNYLMRKLDELFIIFQAENKGDLKDHNKKVINYIRNNRENELFAYEYLDKNFYELVEDFNKVDLTKYLKEKEEELYTAYIKHNNKCEKEKQIIDIDIRINAFDTIIKTLCINFRDYSESIKRRKKIKK